MHDSSSGSGAEAAVKKRAVKRAARLLLLQGFVHYRGRLFTGENATELVPQDYLSRIKEQVTKAWERGRQFAVQRTREEVLPPSDYVQNYYRRIPSIAK